MLCLHEHIQPVAILDAGLASPRAKKSSNRKHFAASIAGLTTSTVNPEEIFA
jgi:hypothetical protein